MKVAMNATHGSGSNLHDKQHEAIIENRNVAADSAPAPAQPTPDQFDPEQHADETAVGLGEALKSAPTPEQTPAEPAAQNRVEETSGSEDNKGIFGEAMKAGGEIAEGVSAPLIGLGRALGLIKKGGKSKKRKYKRTKRKRKHKKKSYRKR